ncbi:MAG TPA: thioredoxin [Gammaproteobacteria bacterium]|nr:thioredoxin [Gammaproteobacteria bacterium]
MTQNYFLSLRTLFSNRLPTQAAVALLCIAMTTITVQAANLDPSSYFFQESFGNFQDELATAKAEGKKGVMLFFEQNDCPFCARMKRTILNQPEVQQYYRDNFRIFAVNIEGDVDITDFQGKTISEKDFSFKTHRVRATPVIRFFDLQGKKVASYTGATGSKKEFLLLGKFVAEGHYKHSSFTKYKREQRKVTTP